MAPLLARYPDLGARLPPLADDLREPEPGFSYTQWEAYLGIYHGRPVFVYRPTDFELDALHVPRDARFGFSPREAEAQKEHYRRISALGHDRGLFRDEERLSSAVLRDLVEILPRLESTVHVTPTKLRHTAERLIGRDEDLSGLDAAWNDPHKNVVIVRAFGGMGKTSLVATWMAELVLKNWRGAERVFDWSFYSQGTREQSAASADTFMAEALRAFGDPDPTLGSPWDRGARLASLVSKSRCLLVLDGLEPLQHPPGPMEGQLKDSGLSALLKGLAARNAGLCVVTTREKVDDIKQHYGRTAEDVPLTRLTDLAGAALLYYAGARRAGAMAIAPDDQELRAASREVRGHGLTLHLLGRYLRLVEDGDIRKRDTVRLADADEQYQNDATRPYGHAFKAMEAYEKWFAGEGEKGLRQLAILRLLGLFDRPASKHCLDALRGEPVIAGLTEALVGLNPREWKLALSRLEEINLLAVQDDGSVDCHPLLREYFAVRVRNGSFWSSFFRKQLHRIFPKISAASPAWRAAHRRLYEHLKNSTKDRLTIRPTLEDLQPLYQAVAHGCQAGLLQLAYDEVYLSRICRATKAGDMDYSRRYLGAFGADLGALACFFAQPWNLPSPSMGKASQNFILSRAALDLRALGRTTEAIELTRAYLQRDVANKDWRNAAIASNNLCELVLPLGDVAGAVRNAEQSIVFGDRGGTAFERLVSRATLADALHQAGRPADAMAGFLEAEGMQARFEVSYPLLYSLRGFQYCDLLLAEPDRAAWHAFGMGGYPQTAAARRDEDIFPHLQRCREVEQRTAEILKWTEGIELVNLLDFGLDHLTLARAALYRIILQGSETREAKSEIAQAVDGLRRSGYAEQIPRGYLTRAWLRVLEGNAAGARADLDEAWEIAERGPMKLHMADIHLHRARLFFRDTQYPWESPQDDLAAARELIEKCGYGRRKEELEDAERAIGGGRSLTPSLPPPS